MLVNPNGYANDDVTRAVLKQIRTEHAVVRTDYHRVLDTNVIVCSYILANGICVTAVSEMYDSIGVATMEAEKNADILHQKYFERAIVARDRDFKLERAMTNG